MTFTLTFPGQMWRQEQDWLPDCSAAWPSSTGTSRWSSSWSWCYVLIQRATTSFCGDDKSILTCFFLQISWVRREDVVILSHGTTVFTSDNRFSVILKMVFIFGDGDLELLLVSLFEIESTFNQFHTRCPRKAFAPKSNSMVQNINVICSHYKCSSCGVTNRGKIKKLKECFKNPDWIYRSAIAAWFLIAADQNVTWTANSRGKPGKAPINTNIRWANMYFWIKCSSSENNSAQFVPISDFSIKVLAKNTTCVKLDWQGRQKYFLKSLCISTAWLGFDWTLREPLWNIDNTIIRKGIVLPWLWILVHNDIQMKLWGN